MAISVNQFYKNYYSVRLNTLTTQHQIQSNRLTMFTNEVMDIANKINFFENQKVLTLVTPDDSNLAIHAKYFDLPDGFDPADESTWTGDNPYYTTPCQKQLFIYRKLDATELTAGIPTGYGAHPENFQQDNSQWYEIVPYEDGGGRHVWEAGYTPTGYQNYFMDSRVLSNQLMTGQFVFMYSNEQNKITRVGYQDLTFITEVQDQKAYIDMVENLEGEKYKINEMQKKTQLEMQSTEVQIQAIQSMQESTEKVLQKNTEGFKWGA